MPPEKATSKPAPVLFNIRCGGQANIAPQVIGQYARIALHDFSDVLPAAPGREKGREKGAGYTQGSVLPDQRFQLGAQNGECTCLYHGKPRPGTGPFDLG